MSKLKGEELWNKFKKEIRHAIKSCIQRVKFHMKTGSLSQPMLTALVKNIRALLTFFKFFKKGQELGNRAYESYEYVTFRLLLSMEKLFNSITISDVCKKYEEHVHLKIP